MNCCRETTRMGVQPGNRPAYRGIGFEAYLNGTSQGPTPEDARKDGHIIRARCAPLSPASGFPVSWSQQVIHEISWFAHWFTEIVRVAWEPCGD